MSDTDYAGNPGGETFRARLAWGKAATLKERVAKSAARDEVTPPGNGASAQAQHRLERWLSSYPFEGDRTRFAERLSSDGISEGKLLDLLDAPEGEQESEEAGELPWVEEFITAYESLHYSQTASHAPSLLGDGYTELLSAFRPLILRGRERLIEGLEGLRKEVPNSPLDPRELAVLEIPRLATQLTEMVDKTMVLELNVARLRGLLEGDTPEDRFQSFAQRMTAPANTVELLQEYPVVARQAIECVDRWVSASLEFARHLSQDWEKIKQHFFHEEVPARLTGLRSDAGDQHRGGRTVRTLEFDSGHKLVYKPRSIAVDANFQDLLDWVNAHGEHPGFRRLRLLNCGPHGWVEYLEARSCSSEEEVRRFYERQGGYLAILYALGATDFHQENLIAFGEHPVLVDLECLFHQTTDEKGLTQAEPRAWAAVGRSVMSTGMLPQRVRSSGESKGMDASGLGGGVAQPSPMEMPEWERPGTDDMRLVHKHFEVSGANNRPTLTDHPVSPVAYLDSILSCFTEVYSLLREHRRSLLRGDGPLARFANAPIRHIPRSTQMYSSMLGESFHPNLLRDALDRERFFDSLWVSRETHPRLARLFPYEREDLWRADIPTFTASPGSRDLYSSSGERIANYFDRSPLSAACRKILSLDDHDLALQQWLIRASFSTLAEDAGTPRQVGNISGHKQEEASRAELIAAACGVADRLVDLAYVGDDGATWLGLSADHETLWSPRPVENDLYDGLPGIALFLGYLGAVTNNGVYTDLARRALRVSRNKWKDLHETLTSQSLDSSAYRMVGAFDGLSGVVYSLVHLGALWRAPELLDEAGQITEYLPTLLEHDDRYDMVSGAAGCLSVMLCLHRMRPGGKALAVATQCGNHLVEHAEPKGEGFVWPVSAESSTLTGLSHGADGIAFALAELGNLLGQQRFFDVARRVLVFERSVSSPEQNNWPDFQASTAPGDHLLRTEDQPYSMVAWCHGASGVGLSRLRMSRYFDDPEFSSEIYAAIETTRSQGLDGNHCLCHGNLGNLELLLKAGKQLDDKELICEVYREASGVLSDIRVRGWICGTPMTVEIPGLMTGLAGIGYGLLRLAHPDHVPSVLTLDAPHSVNDES